MVVALLTVLGLVLRLWGINFGLPREYHIDEQMYVSGALRLGAGLPLDFGSNGPNLFYYLLLGEYGILFLVARLGGTVVSVAQFADMYKSGDPSAFFMLARLTSVLAGTLLIPATYLFGAQAFDKRVGLTGSAFVAVALFLVRDSHYGTPDMLVVLLSLCALWACVQILQGRRSWGRYVLAGFLVGLAAGTKLTVWPLVLSLVVAHLAGSGGRISLSAFLRLPLLLAACATAAGFAVAYPPVVLDFGFFIDYLRYLQDSSRNGLFAQLQLNPPPGWLFYLKSLDWGLGLPSTLLALAGLGWSAWRRRAVDAMLLAFVIPYLLWISFSNLLYARYLLPAVPVLLLLGARLLWDIVKRLAGAGQHIGRVAWVGAAIAALLMIQPVALSLRHDVLLTRVDTRALAAEWILENVPEGAKLALDWRVHTPPIGRAVNISYRGDELYQLEVVGGNGLSDHTLEWYREQGFDYLVTTSFITSIPLREVQADQERREFYARLDDELVQVQQFLPYAEGQSAPAFVFAQIYGPATSLWQFERPGPAIKVYQLQ